jgi:hypothetical protein
MKNILASVACAILVSQTAAQDLLAYWPLNNPALPGGSFGYRPGDIPIFASHGEAAGQAVLEVDADNWDQLGIDANGNIVYEWIKAFAGTPINARLAEPSGGSLALLAGMSGLGPGRGAGIHLFFNAKEWEQLSFSFAAQRTNFGYSEAIVYAFDGNTYLATIGEPSFGSFGLYTYDASVLAGRENAQIIIVIGNASSPIGNNRFDNFVIEGERICAGVRSQPEDAIATSGETVILDAEFFGPIIFYQWQRTLLDGTTQIIVDDGRITGSRSSQLTIPNVTLDDEGRYTLVAFTTCPEPYVIIVANEVILEVQSNTIPPAIHLGDVATTADVFAIDSFDSNFDTELGLWDSNGLLLAENDDAGGTFQSEIAGLNLAEGTYYFSVSAYDTVFGPLFGATTASTITGQASGYVNGTFWDTSIAAGQIQFYSFNVTDSAAPCPGDIADDFGTLGSDDQVSFGDFLALLGLIGPCPSMTPGCTGDIADDFGTLDGDGQVSFGDFLALLGLIGPCL